MYTVASGEPGASPKTAMVTCGGGKAAVRLQRPGIAAYLARLPSGRPLAEIVAGFLASSFAARGFPLRYWSKDRLMSVEARRVWVEPDLRPLDLENLPL